MSLQHVTKYYNILLWILTLSGIRRMLQLHIMLTYTQQKKLYLLGDIGEFRTITNFKWSGSSVLKKIQMNVPFNETLFSNVVMPFDCTHAAGQSFNRIKFRLVNSRGIEPNLKNNWSFSLILAIQKDI